MWAWPRALGAKQAVEREGGQSFSWLAPGGRREGTGWTRLDQAGPGFQSFLKLKGREEGMVHETFISAGSRGAPGARVLMDGAGLLGAEGK